MGSHGLQQPFEAACRYKSQLWIAEQATEEATKTLQLHASRDLRVCQHPAFSGVLGTPPTDANTDGSGSKGTAVDGLIKMIKTSKSDTQKQQALTSLTKHVSSCTRL